MSVTETERPEVFWVNATSKHVVDAMNGKDVEARFRDRADGTWTCGSHILTGWVRTHVFPWKSSERNGPIAQWKFCQVYEPQSWWLERPDPGPGWRLLDKFPDEPKLATDETWNRDGQMWVPITKENGKQDPTVWYRRRIEQLLSGHRWLANGDRLESGDLYYEKGSLLEVGHEYWGNNVMLAKAFMRKIEQPKPEPKHYVLRVGDSCETPCGNRTVVISQSGTQRFVNFRVGDIVKTIHGQTITITEKGFEVC